MIIKTNFTMISESNFRIQLLSTDQTWIHKSAWKMFSLNVVSHVGDRLILVRVTECTETEMVVAPPDVGIKAFIVVTHT